MFDINKLCELCTNYSSYYSFTYDKKENHFVPFKTGGNLTEEEEDFADYIVSMPHRFTPPVSFKASNFADLRDTFIQSKEMNASIKNKKQFIKFLEDNNCIGEWIIFWTKFYSLLAQKYVEENSLPETMADSHSYQLLEDELITFRNNYTKLNEHVTYISDDLFGGFPFTFSYFKNKNYIVLQIKYNTSAIAFNSISEIGDENFINPSLAKAVVTGISIRIDLDRDVICDPESIQNTVNFVYSSRGRIMSNTLPLSAALYIETLLYCINLTFKDKRAMKIISSTKNKTSVNLSLMYDDKEFEIDNPGEKGIMNALSIYTFNERLIADLENTFKTKHKYNYAFKLEAQSEKSLRDNKPMYKIYALIKNLDTKKVTTIYPDSFDSYNPLEDLAVKVLSFFEKNGRYKTITIPTFYDYFYFATIFSDWSTKGDYAQIDFTEEEIEEDDNDYIQA